MVIPCTKLMCFLHWSVSNSNLPSPVLKQCWHFNFIYWKHMNATTMEYLTIVNFDMKTVLGTGVAKVRLGKMASDWGGVSLLCVYACFVLSADVLKKQAWNSYESINASFRVSNALSVFGLVISVNIPLHLNPSFFNSLTSPTRYKVNHKSDTIIFFVGVISILNISCCCYVFRYLCYRVSLY